MVCALALLWWLVRAHWLRIRLLLLGHAQGDAHPCPLAELPRAVLLAIIDCLVRWSPPAPTAEQRRALLECFIPSRAIAIEDVPPDAFQHEFGHQGQGVPNAVGGDY